MKVKFKDKIDKSSPIFDAFQPSNLLTSLPKWYANAYWAKKLINDDRQRLVLVNAIGAGDMVVADEDWLVHSKEGVIVHYTDKDFQDQFSVVH